jgi:hypothetical protein
MGFPWSPFFFLDTGNKGTFWCLGKESTHLDQQWRRKRRRRRLCWRWPRSWHRLGLVRLSPPLQLQSRGRRLASMNYMLLRYAASMNAKPKSFAENWVKYRYNNVMQLMLLTLDASSNAWSLAFYLSCVWGCKPAVFSFQVNRHFTMGYRIIIYRAIHIHPDIIGKANLHQTSRVYLDKTRQ